VLDFPSPPAVEELVSPVASPVVAGARVEGGQPGVVGEEPSGRDDDARTMPDQADARYHEETLAPAW